MVSLLIILFLISYACMLHTYVFFPFVLRLLSRNKMDDTFELSKPFTPQVLVLLPIFNEEITLHKTIEYLKNLEYDAAKIHFALGSDCSTDSSDAIINKLIAGVDNFSFDVMQTRVGKPNVLNYLVDKYKQDAEILIFLDAGALLDSEVILHLVKNFAKKQTGIVAANFKYKPDPNNKEVAYQEQLYIDRENEIKHMESVNWGSVMGVFGACYAVRTSLFKAFPHNFIVDDFYITMHVLKNGYHALHEPKALVLDYNNSTMQNEFKRKVRISIGNFQNLAEYFDMLWQRGWGVGFSFFSHKVLRWMGPFLIIMMLISSLLLGPHFMLFKALFAIQFILMLTPFIDYVMNKMNLQFYWLRNISYFYFMNFALLVGFVKYLKGVKSSIWQPLGR